MSDLSARALPYALGLALASGLAGGFALRGCIPQATPGPAPLVTRTPAASPTVTPPPSPRAEGTAQGEASTGFEATITRTRRIVNPADLAPGRNDASRSVDRGDTSSSTSPARGEPLAPQYEETETIVIKGRADASSSAKASASVPTPEPPAQVRPEVPRVGLLVGSFAGTLAASFRVAGADLEPVHVGVDLEANLQQLGAGVSLSSDYTGPVFIAAGLAKPYTVNPLDLSPWYGAGVRLHF